MFEKHLITVKSAHDLSSEMKSMMGSAADERIKISFALNFGAMRTTASYLEPIELLKLQ